MTVNPSRVMTCWAKKLVIASPMLSIAMPFMVMPLRSAVRAAARVLVPAFGVLSPEISMTWRVQFGASANGYLLLVNAGSLDDGGGNLTIDQRVCDFGVQHGVCHTVGWQPVFRYIDGIGDINRQQ